MNKLPKIGDLLSVDGISTIKLEDFDPNNHAIPDLWQNGDKVEVISITDINDIDTPLVKNLRTSQLSPIALRHLIGYEDMVKRYMRDIIDECRGLNVFDMESAVIDSMYARLNIKLKEK